MYAGAPHTIAPWCWIVFIWWYIANCSYLRILKTKIYPILIVLTDWAAFFIPARGNLEGRREKEEKEEKEYSVKRYFF